MGIPVEPFPELFDLVATECDLPTKEVAQVDIDLAMLRAGETRVSTKNRLEEEGMAHLLERLDDGIEASLRARLVRLGHFRCQTRHRSDVPLDLAHLVRSPSPLTSLDRVLERIAETRILAPLILPAVCDLVRRRGDAGPRLDERDHALADRSQADFEVGGERGEFCRRQGSGARLFCERDFLRFAVFGQVLRVVILFCLVTSTFSRQDTLASHAPSARS